MSNIIKIIKYILLLSILILSIILGKQKANKYQLRQNELEEMARALSIFRTKIKFTYEPIPEVFNHIYTNINSAISQIFKNACIYISQKSLNASQAWECAVKEYDGNIKNEDKKAILTLSKLLGVTDIEGQISQIDITEKFLTEQINKAKKEREKNEKLYKKLGITVGLAIVIILI